MIHVHHLNAHLSAHGNFAGLWPSGADIQMSFPLQAVVAVQSLAQYPAIAAFVSRIEQDTAWQRVVARAGLLTMPGQ